MHTYFTFQELRLKSPIVLLHHFAKLALEWNFVRSVLTLFFNFIKINDLDLLFLTILFLLRKFSVVLSSFFFNADLFWSC